MGLVYEVYDCSRGMRVALKTLRRVDATSLYRFKREFRVLSDLCHPNIVGLYELFADSGDWFLIMELVPGDDFLSYVQGRQKEPRADLTPAPISELGEGEYITIETRDLTHAQERVATEPIEDAEAGLPVPPDADERPCIEDLVDLGRLRTGLAQLARALCALHSADVAHRDLKPSNVRVTDSGRVVLMDFGVVAELRHDPDPEMDELLVGTPAFMAPEQLAGAAASAAADWYAFGVMMYMALTGRLPYRGTREQFLHAKACLDPRRPSQFAQGIPAELEDLCMSCLARAPAARPHGAEVLVAAAGLSDIERERAVAQLGSTHLTRASRIGHESWLDMYHDKIRESVIERLAPERITADHGALAVSMQAWDSAPAAAMARHWLAAGEREQAVVYFMLAARSASSQLAFERAAELYQSALELLPPGDDGSDRHSDVMRCHAWIGLAEGMRMVDRNDEAMALLERALALASRYELAAELAAIHNLRGNLLFPRGDIDGCMREHGLARDYARRARSPVREARALSGLGDAYYQRGRMISAYEHFDRCIALCRQHGFSGIEAANLSMRGMTRYYQNDLAAALQDGVDAARAAASLGNRRAEIVARNGCIAWILFEMGRFEEAHAELDRALAMARTLGARRLQPSSLTFLAKLMAMEGGGSRRAEAVALAQESVAMCRDTGMAFVGPMALGALALVARDDDTRRRALAEGEEILCAGTASHNYLYFYRDAMDVCLATGNIHDVERYARALEDYTSAEPLPWSRFFVARARALARHARGDRDPALFAELTRLYAEARSLTLYRASSVMARTLVGFYRPAPHSRD